MKRTEHVIYNSYDIYNEDCMKDAKETLLEKVFGDSNTTEIADNFGKGTEINCQ